MNRVRGRFILTRYLRRIQDTTDISHTRPTIATTTNNKDDDDDEDDDDDDNNNNNVMQQEREG
jgi:hypothetical protein